jgi:hypothetical protein
LLIAAPEAPLPLGPLLSSQSQDLIDAIKQAEANPQSVLPVALYPQYRCRLCGDRFTEVGALASHVKWHQSSVTPGTAPAAKSLQALRHEYFASPQQLARLASGMGKVITSTTPLPAQLGEQLESSALVTSTTFARAWFEPVDMVDIVAT